MRTGGRASGLITVENIKQATSLIKILEQEDIGYLIIGGGTNIVFSGDFLNILLIKLGRSLGSINLKDKNLIEAGASAATPLLVKKAASAGMDLSYLAGIPGSVGGAVAGNSGSAEKWICSNIKWLKYIKRSPEGIELAECSGNEIKYGYRSLNIQGLAAVVSVGLRPDRCDPALIKSRIEKNIAIRKKTQPINAKTSGCFFKNPGCSDMSAGALIEKCGMKGFFYGGARVSPVHANFIENFNKASGSDIVILSKIIKAKVQEKYGIVLKYEVRVVG